MIIFPIYIFNLLLVNNVKIEHKMIKNFICNKILINVYTIQIERK